MWIFSFNKIKNVCYLVGGRLPSKERASSHVWEENQKWCTDYLFSQDWRWYHCPILATDKVDDLHESCHKGDEEKKDILYH